MPYIIGLNSFKCPPASWFDNLCERWEDHTSLVEVFGGIPSRAFCRKSTIVLMRESNLPRINDPLVDYFGTLPNNQSSPIRNAMNGLLPGPIPLEAHNFCSWLAGNHSTSRRSITSWRFAAGSVPWRGFHIPENVAGLYFSCNNISYFLRQIKDYSQYVKGDNIPPVSGWMSNKNYKNAMMWHELFSTIFSIQDSNDYSDRPLISINKAGKYGMVNAPLASIKLNKFIDIWNLIQNTMQVLSLIWEISTLDKSKALEAKTQALLASIMPTLRAIADNKLNEKQLASIFYKNLIGTCV